jgi:hypothetical protein
MPARDLALHQIDDVAKKSANRRSQDVEDIQAAHG